MLRQVVFASLRTSRQDSRGCCKAVHSWCRTPLSVRVLPSVVECPRLLDILFSFHFGIAVLKHLWILLLQSARGFLNQVTASFTRRRTVEPSGSPGKPASPSSITALLGGESPVGGTAAGEAGEGGLLGASSGPIWQQLFKCMLEERGGGGGPCNRRGC